MYHGPDGERDHGGEVSSREKPMKLLINPPIGTEAVADLQAVVPGVDITNAQTDAEAE